MRAAGANDKNDIWGGPPTGTGERCASAGLSRQRRAGSHEAMERRTAVKLIVAAGAAPLLASVARRAGRIFPPGRPIVDGPTDDRMPVPLVSGFLAGSLTRRSVQFG